MKKAFSIIILITSLTIMSCNSFLDMTPKDFISPENYFKTEAELNMALAGVYDILGKEEVYGNSIPLLFSTADEGYYSRSDYFNGPAVYNYDASNPFVDLLWKFLYKGIERANLLLENVDKVAMDQTAKSAIIGEAKFLRAYYYYMLVDFWGDVPLKTKTTSSVNQVNIRRTPSKDIYAFILKEMEEAEPMVRTATSIGHGGKVSKTTVQGILARVCLKMAGEPLNDISKFNEALKWAKKVVIPENGPVEHVLNADYANIFIKHCSDQYDVKESMWEVEFYGNRSGDFEAGKIGYTLGLRCDDEVLGISYGFIFATFKLFNSYENNDLRRDWTISPFQYTYTTASNGLKTVSGTNVFTANQIFNRDAAKWRRSYEVVLPRNKNYTPINFPLLRYSDVLLMLAEAENEVNGPTILAKNSLKAVRDRALASDLTAGVSDKDDFRTLVKNERFRELAFEGLRRHDLIRWGDFISTMKDVSNAIGSATGAGASFTYGALAGKNVNERHKYLPIPLSELSLNHEMTQNPSW